MPQISSSFIFHLFFSFVFSESFFLWIMGNTSSKQRKNEWKIPRRVSNKSCECQLYQQAKHCCFRQCFPKIKNVNKISTIPGQYDSNLSTYTQSHIQAFQIGISILNMNISSDVISIIFSFLTLSLVDGYYMHCRIEINKYIENGGNICPIWWNHLLNTEQNELKYPQLQVCMIDNSSSSQSALLKSIGYDRRYCHDEATFCKLVTIEATELSIQLNIMPVVAIYLPLRSYVHEWRGDIQFVIICFTINDRMAMTHCVFEYNRFILEWMKQNDQCVHGNQISKRGMMLVACKMDLMYDDQYECDDEEKKIMKENYENALKLSKIWNIPFIETSSSKQINVDRLYRQIVFEYWIQTQTKGINVKTWNECWSLLKSNNV